MNGDPVPLPEDTSTYQNSYQAKMRSGARLKPMKDGKRESYVTLLAYEHNGEYIELIIGARSKKLVREVFERLAPGFKIIPEFIHNVTWSKTDD